MNILSGQYTHRSATQGAARDLDRLVVELRDIDWRRLDPAAVYAVLHESRVDDASLAPYVRFAADRHTRNGVYRDEQFELIVICWPAGLRSAVHDHGASRGFVKAERGALHAENFRVVEHGCQPGPARLASVGTAVLGAGEVDQVGPGREIHRVGAHGADAIALHVYAKPIDQFLIFDCDAQTCRRVTARYDRAPRTVCAAG